MYEPIASGGAFDLANLGSYESYLDEGDKGMLELDLTMPVPQGVADTLETQLRQAGVEGVRVTTASPRLRIYFTKGFPWLAVIAGVVLGLVVLAIMIVGWSLYKEVISAIPGGGAVSLGIIAAVTILVILAYVGTREVIEEKAKKVIYG